MDFLNQAYSQILDLFRSMTPAARITTGLLLAVVVVSLVFLFRYDSSSADEYLLGGRTFSQREIATMEPAFAKAGLNHWEISGYRVRVPRGQKFAYLAALADDNALPEDFDTAFAEMIGNDGPFVSRQLREMKLKHATQKELALVVSRMKGVETASVKYDEVNKGGFPARKEKRAMVAVSAAGNHRLDEEQVRAIRDTVTAAIGGLDRENVTVTDLNVGRAWPGVGDGEAPSASDNIYASNKRMFEKGWRDKIYERLSMYPGIVVGVNVELEPELNHRTNTIEYDSRPVPLAATEYRRDTRSVGPEGGGRPGAVSNRVGNAPAAVSSAAATQSELTETRDEQRSVTGQTQTTRHRAPLVPNRVTASIDVPTSYFAKVWRERNATAEGDEPRTPDAGELKVIEEETKRKIEEAVASLLPPMQKTGDDFPRVTVTTYQDLALPPAAQPTVAETAFSWLGGNWPTLAMVLVGLFSLLMLRSMIRSAPPNPAPAAEQAPPFPSAQPLEEAAEQEAAIQKTLKRRLKSSGPSLRDELTEMVKEDPDAAANILRNWIGDAA